jgi:nucleotide-binding universal stress UspA family protein
MSSVAASASVGVQVKSVLIATDFSPASQKALRHAISIARHYGAKFYLMHVVSSVGFRMVGPEAVVAATDLAWRDVRQVEKNLVASGVLKDVPHQTIVRDGDIWTELEGVLKQERIDMVVIGTHSRKGLGKFLLGSVAEQIFRRASCLVLTVGPNSPADAEMETTGIARPLLFATDLGEGSLRALPCAISLANQRGTRLVLLHVIASVPQLEGNRWYTAADVMQARKTTRVASLQRLKDLVSRSAALALEPAFMAEFGEPAEGILRAAEELHAEAVIMGLRRREHIDTISHLPWSTAYAVVCGAVCPIITVRS